MTTPSFKIIYTLQIFLIYIIYSELKLPKFQDSGRLIGYGHVTFESPDARDLVKL